MSSKSELTELQAALLATARPFSKADGARITAARAEPVPLSGDLTIPRAFELIAASCLQHFRLNQRLITEARDAEALHQARVALRRLRAGFALFGPVVDDEESKRIEDELRWLVAQLGDARNLDVYLERDLSRDQRRFVEERRNDAYNRASTAMMSARFKCLVLDIDRWITQGDWRQSSSAGESLDHFLQHRLDALWEKASDCRPVAKLGDHRRHRLRLRFKKLRYALEFADGLFTGEPARKLKFAKRVKRVQESLGSLHDMVTAASIITLNSWLEAKEPSAKHKKRLAHDADHAIARMRRIGPYWHEREAAA